MDILDKIGTMNVPESCLLTKLKQVSYLSLIGFETFEFKINSNVIRKFKVSDYIDLMLIHNQLNYITRGIDFAQFTLISSCSSVIETRYKNILSKGIKSYDDTLKFLSHKYLINSLVIYDSLFEYLNILIVLLIKSRNEIRQEFTEDKVNIFIKKHKLNDDLWFIALGRLIGRKEKYLNEPLELIKDKDVYLFNLYISIKNLKMKFVEENHVNAIKHAGMALYSTSDDNILDSEFLVSKNTYYQNNEFSVSFGSSPFSMNIKDTQELLIKYNNEYILMINYIIDHLAKV